MKAMLDFTLFPVKDGSEDESDEGHRERGPRQRLEISSTSFEALPLKPARFFWQKTCKKYKLRSGLNRYMFVAYDCSLLGCDALLFQVMLGRGNGE